MIPVHQEPKGLSRDAIPEACEFTSRMFREGAERGSRKLRDAILRAEGIVIPYAPKPIKKPTVCPLCYAPVGAPKRYIATIQQVVAAYYSLSVNSMTSGDRRRDISHPRQVAMYLANELTDHSIAEIGRRFKRDHTTVLHALKAVPIRVAADSQLAFDVSFLRERLS